MGASQSSNATQNGGGRRGGFVFFFPLSSSARASVTKRQGKSFFEKKTEDLALKNEWGGCAATTLDDRQNLRGGTPPGKQNTKTKRTKQNF
jgi:hypothetical protein